MNEREFMDLIGAYFDKYECQNNEFVKEMRYRVNNCVCKYCGSELILRNITYGNAEEGRLELFCPNCNRIEYGVEPEIYRIAKYYVDEMKFDYYEGLDKSDRKDRMNLAKVNEIMQWCCKNLGFLTKNGFTNELKLDNNLTSKDILLEESYLKNL